LAAERAFLLKRLQAMSRSLERRAESIRGFFETELRRGDTRLQKANLQVPPSPFTSLQRLTGTALRVSIVAGGDGGPSASPRFSSEKRQESSRGATAALSRGQSAAPVSTPSVTHCPQENEALREKLTSVLSDREASVSKQLDDSSLRSLHTHCLHTLSHRLTSAGARDSSRS
jgi:hypothetical protein